MKTRFQKNLTSQLIKSHIENKADAIVAKTFNRSEIFKAAHQAAKANNEDLSYNVKLSIALKAAWTAAKTPKQEEKVYNSCGAVGKSNPSRLYDSLRNKIEPLIIDGTIEIRDNKSKKVQEEWFYTSGFYGGNESAYELLEDIAAGNKVVIQYI